MLNVFSFVFTGYTKFLKYIQYLQNYIAQLPNIQPLPLPRLKVRRYLQRGPQHGSNKRRWRVCNYRTHLGTDLSRNFVALISSHSLNSIPRQGLYQRNRFTILAKCVAWLYCQFIRSDYDLGSKDNPSSDHVHIKP